MMHWFKRRAPAAPVVAAPPAPLVDLSRFDHFTAAEIAALPRSIRRLVVADRRIRTTAKLRREIGA